MSPSATTSSNTIKSTQLTQSQKADATKFYPRLTCQVNIYPNRIVFTQDGQDLEFQIPVQSDKALASLCSLMDGRRSLAELQQWCAPDHPETVSSLVQHLRQWGFLYDDAPSMLPLGGDVFADLNDREHRWVHSILSRLSLKTHWLWQGEHPVGEISPMLMRGIVVEYYQLLLQLYSSCSSILHYSRASHVQALVMDLYTMIDGYAKQLREVLECLAIEADQLDNVLPLSSTITLVHGLTFWANTEPLFFLASLGILLDRVSTTFERYLAVVEGLDPGAQGINHWGILEQGVLEQFIQAVRSLTHIPGNHPALVLTHKIFQTVAHLDDQTQERMQNQVHLLGDMFCTFYAAIDQQYASEGSAVQSRSILRNPGRKIGFKEQVILTFKPQKVELRYQDNGCAIAILDNSCQSLEYFLKLLQMGGLSPEQLAHSCPDIESQIPDLLAEFKQHQLLLDSPLSENKSDAKNGCTGEIFYQDLVRFLTWLKRQFPPSPLSQQLINGSISRNQLIGYALESYHVTALCPQLLAPALAHHDAAATQALLRDFFISELHHDRLLEKSLRSVGISSEQLQRMQPLPTTFAVCSSLSLFAHQHPLSFKAALMLFEEDDKQFHELFEYRCQSLDLPSEFYQPILLHAQINDEGEHDQITSDLLSDIAYISLDEQQIVRKNMTLLMESMVLRTQEILNYYGYEENVFPRVFTP